MEIDRRTYHTLVGAVEDAIAFACDEAFKDGTPISGELAWNIVLCRAMAKVAEFEGLLDPSKED
jgi:hypothetical protein